MLLKFGNLHCFGNLNYVLLFHCYARNKVEKPFCLRMRV